MPKTFIWLLDSTFPRRGPQLESGKEHDASDYQDGVVEEWVKTGAARWADTPAKKSGKSAGKEE